ncbi:MAG: hypothetical protein ACXWPS_13110, partial [Ktedonobacteraceae bacterium]
SWHGGGEGLPGVSSQDGALSTPLRTRLSDLRREIVWLFSRTTADTKRPFPSTRERRWPSMAPSKNKQGGVV